MTATETCGNCCEPTENEPMVLCDACSEPCGAKEDWRDDEIKKLRKALWGFSFARRGTFFCVGCNLKGRSADPRSPAAAPEEWHDDECRAARAALASGPKEGA